MDNIVEKKKLMEAEFKRGNEKHAASIADEILAEDNYDIDAIKIKVAMFHVPMADVENKYNYLKDIVENLVLKEKNSEEAWGLRGRLSFAWGDYKRALESYNKILELYPKNYETLINVAKLLNMPGKLVDGETAKSHLEKAIESNPGRYEAYMELGVFYFRAMNDSKQARKLFLLSMDKAKNLDDPYRDIAARTIKGRMDWTVDRGLARIRMITELLLQTVIALFFIAVLIIFLFNRDTNVINILSKLMGK